MSPPSTEIRETLKRMPFTLRVGNIPGGATEFINIQDAVDYADAQGGIWTIEIFTGVYDQGDITNASGANITLKGMSDRVYIMPTAAPVTAVVILMDGMNLENLHVIAPDATRPAVINNTALVTNEINFCTIVGVAPGYSIQGVGGGLTVRYTDITADVHLSTAINVLSCYYCEFINDIITAGAFAHVLTLKHCNHDGNDIVSGATGATTLEIDDCSEIGTVSNAGTGAFTISETDVATITASSTGTIVATGGYIGACGGATASVTWQTGPNRYEVIPGMEIQHSLTAGAGGEVVIHDGAYAPTANLTVSAETKISGHGRNVVITCTGAAITNGVVLNGDNITILDVKIELAAGAGGAGTRPNIIYASGRTGIHLERLWLVGDTSVADDGSDDRQNGIFFDTVTTSKIVSCTCQSNDRHGIRLMDSGVNCEVTVNTCSNNTQHGIYVQNSNRVLVANNDCRSNSGCGLRTQTCLDFTCDGNKLLYNTQHGLYIDGSTGGITGNTCSHNSTGVAYNGIYCFSCDEITFTGNTCDDNGNHGIYIYRSSSCTVSGNECFDQRDGDGIRITGDALTNSDYNNLSGNTCRGNAGYGIQIIGGTDANENIIKVNELSGNTTGPFANAGNNTRLATYEVPFSHGSDPQDSGYLIDANGEFARTWLRLPADVQQIDRMRIYARSVVAEADKMMLEINVNGGASNEAFNTHATAAPNTASETDNFAADDIIYWELSSAQIVALVGGDSIEAKVLHEAAGGDDCATNAYLRTVEFHYV